MAEDIVLLVGKVIGRLKKVVFDVALLSHATEDEFNKMILFDVKIFWKKKVTFQKKIYNSSHPCTDSIQEYALLDRSDQGVTYNLDDVINNDSDF